jgi:hypothetical protein
VTYAELTYSIAQLVPAIPFAFFMTAIAVALRVTWGRWL